MYYGPCAKYTLAATKARGGKAFGHWFHLKFPDNFSELICESWDWRILALWKCNTKISITNTRGHEHDSSGWLTFCLKDMICNVTITDTKNMTASIDIYIYMCIYICVCVRICIWNPGCLPLIFDSMMYGMVRSTNTWKISNITVWICLGFPFVKMVDSGPLYTWRSEMSLHLSDPDQANIWSTKWNDEMWLSFHFYINQIVPKWWEMWESFDWTYRELARSCISKCLSDVFQVFLCIFQHLWWQLIHRPALSPRPRGPRQSCNALALGHGSQDHSARGPSTCWQPWPATKQSTHDMIEVTCCQASMLSLKPDDSSHTHCWTARA